LKRERAKIVLLASEGLENKEIGERLDMPRPVVSKWRKRFFRERLAGPDDRSRRGRPSAFPPQVVAEVLFGEVVKKISIVPASDPLRTKS